MEDNYQQIRDSLASNQVELIAVSKRQPIEKIKKLYDLGQRDFGENYAQELLNKKDKLPKDIKWHFIGHLQTNKVKYITPFVHMIHTVDSLKLLDEIQKKSAMINKVTQILLQVNISKEENKSGLNHNELLSFCKVLNERRTMYSHLNMMGLMGMSSYTDDLNTKEKEFEQLSITFKKCKEVINSEHFNHLSMGMSDDYTLSIKYGATMVRIGTKLFGQRKPKTSIP